MRRKAVIFVTLASAAACLVATMSVEAQRARRGRRTTRTAAAPQAAPESAEIAPALGEVRWGQTPRELNDFFAKQITDRFAERIQKAPGAIEEDRLRHDMAEEVRRLRASYTRFDGERTGWDLSFLRGEFTHGNRESMLVVRDDNSQNFYFFIQGRLWKWYKAFDAAVFNGQSFDQFAEAIQNRFGRAADRTGSLVEGGPQQHWLEWQDSTTRLRAIDNTRFYDFFCLVFEEKATVGRLATLRANTMPDPNAASHALVDSAMTEDTAGDQNADIVDRLTGQIRERRDAPAPAAGSTTGGSTTGARRPTSGSSSSGSSSGTRTGSSGGGLDLGDL